MTRRAPHSAPHVLADARTAAAPSPAELDLAAAGGAAPPPAEPDVETASDAYARRFAGPVGEWLLARQAALALDLLAPWPDARVLDVGGGHAQLAGPLVRRGYRLTVTGSAESCRVRLDRALPPGSFTFRRAGLAALPFPDRGFDCVVSVRTLTHAADWRRLLAELLRVAARAVVVDYPETSGANRFHGALFRWKRAVEGDTRPYRRFARGEVAREAAPHGFGRAELRRQVLLPLVVHRAAGSAAFTRAVEAAGERLGLTARLGGPALLRLERMA